MSSSSFGKVYLVGAGPGDPGLLTLRAKECLERADAVIYDALVNPALLEHAPRAERIFAGKQADRHSLPQEEINRILIEQAARHAMVVRLKGGDPFVFGRGGEEALALAEAGIAFEVVPGVTAAVGCAAYAGIPLTHRGLASRVTFLTGHSGQDTDTTLFSRLPEGTLVFYMGVKNLGKIVAAVRGAGRAAETPAAVIEWGTYARQRTVVGTLDSMEARCQEAAVDAPAILIVGEVVTLREQLSWFEARPLYGLRVVVTHRAQPNGLLESRLHDLGASVFEFPTLELAPRPQAALLEEVRHFDWIIFTSSNAVEMIFEHLEEQQLDARALAGVRLCAVGHATCDSLRRRYLQIEAQPDGFEASTVLEALEAFGPLSGQKVLLPRSDIARTALPLALREAGAVVSEIAAYEKRIPSTSAQIIAELMEFQPELLVFTNAGAVRNFVRMLGREQLDSLMQSAACASIGPITSRALEEEGLHVSVEPVQHELVYLMEAICAWRQTN